MASHGKKNVNQPGFALQQATLGQRRDTYPDWSLRPDQQGLLVLGTPLGSDAFVPRLLELKRAEHDKLLTRIPAVEDLQSRLAPVTLLRLPSGQLPPPRVAACCHLALCCGARRRS